MECNIDSISNVMVSIEVNLDFIKNVVLLQLSSNILNSLQNLLSSISIEYIRSDAVQEGIACGTCAQDTQGIDTKRRLCWNMLFMYA